MNKNILQVHGECCIHHGGPCRPMRARLHVAGTECIHFSRQSPTRPGTRGSRMVYFFVWIAQRRQMREEFIIHENVEDFPPSLLEDLLGDLYELSGTSVFCCSTQGVAYERKRRWTFLVLRNSPTMAAIAAGQRLLPSWPNFKDLFARECSWTWES